VTESLNNLAELYRIQGRYPEAEPLYRRSLAIRERTLGPEHPSVATSLNNLAAFYHVQGRYAEAEPLYRRTLVILLQYTSARGYKGGFLLNSQQVANFGRDLEETVFVCRLVLLILLVRMARVFFNCCDQLRLQTVAVVKHEKKFGLQKVGTKGLLPEGFLQITEAFVLVRARA